MSFFIRHALGFFIQIGLGVLLCYLPFEESEFCYSRKHTIISAILLAVIPSILFPIFISEACIADTSYQTLAANLYMTVFIVLFVLQYFWVMNIETIKKVIALILVLFYGSTQYFVVNVIEIQVSNYEKEQGEVYTSIGLALFALTAVVMFPISVYFMRRLVHDYLIEMDIKSINRDSRTLFVITFLYFIMLVIYTAGPVALFQRFWLWIVPPMLMTSVLLSFFYVRFFREAVVQKRENEKRKTVEIQALQYKNINREMESVRRMRHDMHHTLNYLSELLAQGEDEQAKEFLSELTEQANHRVNVIYCKNDIVNGLLQYYVGIAQEQGIKCRVSADCEDVSVSSVDLTVLFGNMMENAIRACSKQEEQWITVKIGVIGKSMLIQVTNPCNEVHPSDRYRMDDNFLPADAYQSDHAGGGQGLRSLEHTAEKYGGVARFKYDSRKKTFTTRVRLNLKRE